MKTIHDFGSKIGGARKDVWVKRGLCIEDTKNMTASEKEKYIKRDYIWPKYLDMIYFPYISFSRNYQFFCSCHYSRLTINLTLPRIRHSFLFLNSLTYSFK